jgi:tetratricopeptide (TPR) repeat protein
MPTSSSCTAPELFEGRSATVQSDIYALGVLLWHLLTGAYPVAGADVGEVRQAHLEGRRLRLRDKRPDLPAAVIAVVERAVESDSTRRFTTSGVMEVALVHALHASESTARPTRPAAGDALQPQTRRRAWLATMSVAGLIGLSVITWYLTQPGGGSERDPAPTAARPPEITTRPAENPPPARATQTPSGESPRPPATAPVRLLTPPVTAAPVALPFVFGERDWILVGAFENRTDVAALDGTIGFAVERDLATTPGISVVSQTRVIDTLRLMKRPDTAVIDRATGLEVCLRDGGVRALLAAVHALANQVRTAIGAVPATSAAAEAPLEHATTTSLTALQLYSQAVQAGSAEQWGVSAQLAKAAVAEDPSFASAHAWLARSLLATGKGPEARAALEQAVTHVGGVSGRERLLILAMNEDAQQHKDEAIAAYEAYLRVYPDDVWALDSLVMLYGAASDKVARLKVRAAELRPRSFKANRDAAVWLMAQNGDLARARRFTGRARALLEVDSSPAYKDWVRFEPAFEDWLRGDLRGMAERVPASQWRPGLALFRDLERAWMAFHRQDLAAVSTWADALTQAKPVPWPSFHAVWMLRRMDRVDDAVKMSQARAAQSPELDWVIGDLALGRGDVDTASARIGSVWPDMVAGNPVTLMATEAYAEALERQGRLDKAIAVLEDATRDKVRLYQAMRSSIPKWLRVRARLAADCRASGRPADARKVEAELRRLLALADPDFVPLKQLPR